jgi:hypothetical protein
MGFISDLETKISMQEDRDNEEYRQYAVDWKKRKDYEDLMERQDRGCELAGENEIDTGDEISKLIDLLGSESGDKWLEFMDYVSQNLSHILSRGKPKSEDIQQSIIGMKGFKSWGDLVESPTSDGGLGWKLATFDSWKRAFAVVGQYQYLRNMGLTASFINTIHRETKPDFPSCESDFNAFLAKRTDVQVSRQQNSLKDAQNVSEELKKQNLDLIRIMEQQEINIAYFKQQADQSAALTERLLRAEKKVTELEIALENTQEDSRKAKNSLKNKSKKLEEFENMGWFAKLKTLF